MQTQTVQSHHHANVLVGQLLGTQVETDAVISLAPAAESKQFLGKTPKKKPTKKKK